MKNIIKSISHIVINIFIISAFIFPPLPIVAQNTAAAEGSVKKESARSGNIYDFSKDIGPNHKPTTDTEIELWELADKLEARFNKNSSQIIKDPKLNAYVKSVLCNIIGDERCAPIRLYLLRRNGFNASMAPNGMMQVWSGLIVRMENEAQLAAILAHEYAHYVRRHSLQSIQLLKGVEVTSSTPYVGLFASLGSVSSLFSFRREMEKEADQLSLEYINAAGYNPYAPAKVWQQLTDEFEITRPEYAKDTDVLSNFFATHPNREGRLDYLSRQAEDKKQTEDQKDEGLGSTDNLNYRKNLGIWWSRFISDQIKSNNFETSEYLVDKLAKGGWDAELYLAKAELFRKRAGDGDFELAIENYRKSIDEGSKNAESLRGLGLSLMRNKQREEGVEILKEYLIKFPDAVDKNMIQLLTGTKLHGKNKKTINETDQN